MYHCEDVYCRFLICFIAGGTVESRRGVRIRHLSGEKAEEREGQRAGDVQPEGNKLH